MTEISADAQKALDRAMKVLETARRTKGNEAEAEVAANKFQELLEKYNLDEAQVEAAGGRASGKREERKVRGGFYKHQEQLWSWAAEINFCLYWCTTQWVKEDFRRVGYDGRLITDWRYKRTKRHEIVGRTHNVAATIALAEYLEEAIDRVVMEEMHGDNRRRFSNYAVSMRKGMAAKLCNKMHERREELLSEERLREQEAQDAAARAAAAGASSSMAVSLASFSKSERDANHDHVFGEGWSAEQAAKRAERAARKAREEAEYARWAADHPEEARAKAEERRLERAKRDKQRASKSTRSDDDNIDYSAWNRGYAKADDIGLDQQVRSGTAGRIG